jgi:hypothetical protein
MRVAQGESVSREQIRDERTPLTAGGRQRRLRIGRFELAVLLAFAGLSAWVLALDLWQVTVHRQTWTGTDGVFVVDQMQYLAWIRDASHHVLISNLFMLAHSPADFFEPLFAISGGVAALGAAPWVVLLLWQPVAVLAVFFATRAYVHRALDGAAARGTALVLALFFIGSGAVIAEKLVHTGVAARLQWSAITNDLWLGFWSWGYPFGLVALAAMMAAILAYERDRAAGRAGWAPPLLAALASAVHPWQGGTLILVLIGAETVMWRRGESFRIRALLPVTVAATLPPLYFSILNHTDPSWKLAQSSARGSFPLWMVALTLGPLLVPAALVYRVRAQTFLALVTRLWPAAALVLFLISETRLSAAPTHALLGITIPLAVLAVDGVRSVRWRGRLARHGTLAAVAAVVVAIVPAIAYELSAARRLVTPGPLHGQASGPGDANFIDPGERKALDYLADDPRSGGVLTRFYLGTVVPGITGRQTYVGNPYFSPDYLKRIATTDQLFLGKLSPKAARTLARNSGARFALADCQSPAVLVSELSPISSSVHRFGCATVLVLR